MKNKKFLNSCKLKTHLSVNVRNLNAEYILKVHPIQLNAVNCIV